MENYYRIYEQVYESPTTTIANIAKNAGLPSFRVSRCLKEMYAKDILIGPYLLMKPAPNYKEYVYLLNFSNPYPTFEALEQLPQVVYCVLLSGDWNILAIMDSPLDFSKMEGFQNIVSQGMRGLSYTPKATHVTWRKGFEKVNRYIVEFVPAETERSETKPLDWGEDEWKLFQAFEHDLRKEKLPVLREIGVKRNCYLKWIKTLNDHCTIHTEFHPGGHYSSGKVYFLFSSEYRSQIRSLFSLFPASSFFTEVGDELLVLTRIAPPDIGIELFRVPKEMQKKGMIKEFRQTIFLLDYRRSRWDSRFRQSFP